MTVDQLEQLTIEWEAEKREFDTVAAEYAGLVNRKLSQEQLEKEQKCLDKKAQRHKASMDILLGKIVKLQTKQ